LLEEVLLRECCSRKQFKYLSQKGYRKTINISARD